MSAFDSRKGIAYKRKAVSIASLCFIAASVLVLPGCFGSETKKVDEIQQQTQQAPAKNNSAANEQKTFTLDELAKYDGSDGKPAYVALNGIVYDVTNAKLWRDGVHSPVSKEKLAGRDLTELMKKAPPSHAKEGFMNGVPVVGKLAEK